MDDYTNDPLMPAWYIPGFTAQNPNYLLSPVSDNETDVQVPPNLVYVEVTGLNITGVGDPQTGFFGITPSSSVTYTDPDSGDIVRINKSYQKKQLERGALSINLLATDNDDVAPNNFTYHVKENWLGGQEYTIHVPKDSDGPVNIRSLIIDDPVPPDVPGGGGGSGGGVRSVNGDFGPDVTLDAADVSAATASHLHTGVYSPNAHNHDGSYSASGHNHDASYSATSHNHNASYSTLAHNHTGVYDPSGSSDAALAAAEAYADGLISTALLKAQNLNDLPDKSASRTNLGLGNSAVRNVGTSSGTVAAGDDSRFSSALQAASNLSDLISTSTARTNLGLGDAAVKNTGIIAGTLAAGDDSRITGAAQKASNLSDLGSSSTARTNLGLGDSATKNVGTSSGTVAAGDDSRITGAAQKSSNLSDLSNAGTARTNLGVAYGTASGTVAQGNDARFNDTAFYPAQGYGGISISGDPMFYQAPGSFGSNTIIFCRMFIPANAVITAAWFGIRGTSSHDGVTTGNKISIYDDTGANPVSTAVDDTMWTLGGWRGGNLSSPIAAQSTSRFVYALAIVKGMPSGVGFLNPSSANDSNAGTIAIGPAQPKRRAGYWSGQSAMPSSFDPTTIGTASGFASLCLLT